MALIGAGRRWTASCVGDGRIGQVNSLMPLKLRSLQALAGLLFLVLAGPAPAQLMTNVPVWRAGDDPAWSQPGLSGEGWEELQGIPATQRGIFWLRTALDAGGVVDQRDQLVFVLESNAPFDFYLDGMLVGSNGRIDGSGLAAAGYPRIELTVPASFLAPGPHLVAVRTSADGLDHPADFRFFFALEPAAGHAIRTRFRDALDGAAVITALFVILAFLILWLAGTRRPELPITMALCACVCVIIVLDPTGRASHLPNALTAFATAVLALASLGVFILLPALLHVRLGLSRRLAWAGGLLGVILLSFLPVASLDHDARAFILLMLFGGAMTLAAARQRTRLAVAHGAGLAVGLAVILLQPDLLRHFLTAIVLLLSIGLLFELVSGEIAKRRAQARAATLKTELVKRNIQPHFIMNSLTVALEWQETDPAIARRFITALSEEFRALSNMIDRASVELSEEIELCRSHLTMMGLRLDRVFSLETEGLDWAASFPPGVLHTLLENAISHNRYDEGSVVFRLSMKTDKIGVRFNLTAPIGRAPGPAGGSAGKGAGAGAGTGMQYVEARLEEFSPGRWRCESGPEGDNWVTRITLPARRL